jgi:S1-C subfamily serine protease
MGRFGLSLCILLAACAPQPEPAPEVPAPKRLSLLPGSLGMLVREDKAGLVVSELKKDGAAAVSGVRAGDVVLRYNGAPAASLREFNRRVLESVPGSKVRVELLRGGKLQELEVPVLELDTSPRV